MTEKSTLFQKFEMTIIGESLVKTIRQATKAATELNFFQVEMGSFEAFDKQKAAISTRIYIILSISLLTILTVYSALDYENQVVIIYDPTQPDFDNLHKNFPNTLTCPCREVTVPYSSFMSVLPEYHPICSSIFVSDIWINTLFNPNISYFYALDFRSSASGQFQILSSFCSLAKRYVSDGIDDFLSDTLLSPIALSSQTLNVQCQAQSSFVRISTKNAFRRLLQLIRGTTFNNQLQTGLQTSKLRVLFIVNNITLSSYTNQGVFSNKNKICYCGSQLNCSSSTSGFFNLFAYDTKGDYTSSPGLMINVTGLTVGCYAVEAILQSTLECFFDAICLNGVRNFFPNMDITDVKSLDSYQTKYSVKTTIDALVDNLFIEEWWTMTSFEQYFRKCAPILCRYTFMQRKSVLYIVTKVLAVYGGLVVVLRFCVPRIIIWYYKVKNRRLRNNLGKFFLTFI